MSRQHRIEDLLKTALSPHLLRVYNESNQHQVPPHSETHFNLVVVSSSFMGLTRIKRHQMIHQLLTDEFQDGLHALSMHLYTPEEWQKMPTSPPTSPPCHRKSR